jgi:hypothetical protein
MAGSITVSSITLDSDNNFSIKSNTGATILSANGTGLITGIANGASIVSAQLTTPTVSGNLSLDSTGTTGVRAPSANTLAFHTAGTEDMRLTSDGILSIGITNPYTGTKLSVKNSATNTYSATAFPSGRTFDLITNSANTSDYSGIRFSDSANGRESFYGVVQESGGPGAFVWQNYTSAGYSEKMRIDSSGRITKPLQPAFTAYPNTSSGYSDTPLKYDATILNVGNHYNTSTYRFTAPVAGRYLFSYSIWTGSATTTRCAFYKNGSVVGQATYSIGTRNNGTSSENDSASMIIELSVSDYIDIRCYAGDVQIFGANYFMGYLLG